MSICACGACSGYQHAIDCPYPMFYGSGGQMTRWCAARDLARQWQADGTIGTISPAVTQKLLRQLT